MSHLSRAGVAAVAGLVIATSACASSPATQPAAPPMPVTGGEPRSKPRPAAARDSFVLNGLVAIGRSRAEIIERLGRPDSVSLRPFPNRHVQGQTDTIATLYYPTLRAELYVITGGRELLMGVLVRDDRWLTSERIHIGMPFERVLDVLGPPLDTQAGRPAYWCGGCPVPDPVRFHVEDGIVRAIEFTYYVD